MKTPHTLATSALCLLAGSGLTHALAPQPQKAQPKPRYEFLVEPEPDEDRLEELSDEGWDFGGIYGTSDLGNNVSLTLWKRPR